MSSRSGQAIAAVTGPVSNGSGAAHGLSPHLSAGGTLGIEDAAVRATALARTPTDVATALEAYQRARIPRFATVRRFADEIQQAGDATAFAAAYARFSSWMVATAPTGE